MTISLNLRLPYGWSKHRDMLWFSSHAHGPLGKNKGWEWQTDYFGWTNLFSFELDLIPTGSDHAGVGISITILGFMVDAKIYDGRHWDQDAGTWEKYDEESVNFRVSIEEQRHLDRIEDARQTLKQAGIAEDRQSLEEFLETPRGKALLEERVAQKYKEARESKEAKKARGEEYRRRNLGGSGTQEI